MAEIADDETPASAGNAVRWWLPASNAPRTRCVRTYHKLRPTGGEWCAAALRKPGRPASPIIDGKGCRQLTNGCKSTLTIFFPKKSEWYIIYCIELLVERLMPKKKQSNSEMLKGTLDMMILRTLVGGDAHGHTIAKVIERTSEDVLEVEQGSLYPALHRLEDRKWVSSYWGASENNRKAKFYRLTAEGRKQLVRETSRWRQMTRAIGLVLGEEGGAL
jgi:transcriptional regulator